MSKTNASKPRHCNKRSSRARCHMRGSRAVPPLSTSTKIFEIPHSSTYPLNLQYLSLQRTHSADAPNQRSAAAIITMNSLLFCILLTPLIIFFYTQTGIIAAHSMRSARLEFYSRAAVSFLALILCATYGTIASAILTVAGYGGLGQWTTARSFKWAMWFSTGVWFEIRDDGPKPGPPGEGGWLGGTRPAVFIGNHQTELDVLVLAHVFPKYCSVTAKKSLRYWPFLGWFSMF